MTTLTILVALGMLTGAGLYLLLREAAPITQPRLDHALDRLAPDQLTRSTDPRATRNTPQARGSERLGALLEKHLGGRPGFTAPVADLDILGRTTASYWTEKATLALFGLLTPVAFVALAQLTGLALPIVIPAAVGLGLAAVCWVLPDSSIKTKAAKARAEFIQAMVAYLQLSAIQRSASGAQETLYRTAEIGQSWPFERIRQELTRARWARVQPWDALVHLGESTQIPEISEVGDIMRLAGDTNAAVTDNLTERAVSLQNRIMSAEWARANAATSSMAFPITGLVGVMIMAIVIPASIALFAG